MLDFVIMFDKVANIGDILDLEQLRCFLKIPLVVSIAFDCRPDVRC